MTLPGRMPASMSRVSRMGALRPKTLAVVMTMSQAAQTFAMPSRWSSTCSGVSSLAYPCSVWPISPRSIFTNFAPSDFTCSSTTGPRVEGLDAGAEPPGGGDGLQARHADADDEHLGRRNRAGRRHHHRQDGVELVGGGDDGDVAGEIRLAAEHVHLLGDRGARNELAAQGGHAGGGVGFDPLARAEGSISPVASEPGFCRRISSSPAGSTRSTKSASPIAAGRSVMIEAPAAS